MKLRTILISLLIVWGTGCVAYVQPPSAVQLRVHAHTPTVVVRHAPPVVRQVHVHRPARVVVGHRHVHRPARVIVRHRHSHHHTSRCTHRNHRNRSNGHRNNNRRRPHRSNR